MLRSLLVLKNRLTFFVLQAEQQQPICHHPWILELPLVALNANLAQALLRSVNTR